MAVKKPVKRAAKPLTKDAIEKIDNLKQLQGAYAHLFSTADGKLVLADLEHKFYDNALEGRDLNREVGRRDVVRHIKQQVKYYDR